MISIKKNIISLKKEWKNIDEYQRYIYQTYGFQRALFKRLFIYGLQYREKYAYYVVRKDGKVLFIAPLSKKGNTYSIIGNMNGVPVYDFIYAPNFSGEDYREGIKELFRFLKMESITFNWVLPESPLYKYAQEMGTEQTEIDCVALEFGKSYDDYYGGLSKNTRQNIRTAYNRLAKDEVQLKFKLVKGKIDRKTLNQMIEIYCNRHVERYGAKQSSLKKAYLKYFDFATNFYKKNADTYNALLYCNEKLVAFFTGSKSGDRIVVPRLSIDGEYGKYSPGVLLINETVKALTEEGQIRVLDLSKGEEKYKYTMGGERYALYKFAIKE